MTKKLHHTEEWTGLLRFFSRKETQQGCGVTWLGGDWRQTQLGME